MEDRQRALAAHLRQTRARYPDQDGFLERDGVRIFYEAYGVGEPTLLLLPTWEIVHSRAWKCQIPYFARHCRVLTFDRRGNGRSDRPREVHAYDRRSPWRTRWRCWTRPAPSAPSCVLVRRAATS